MVRRGDLSGGEQPPALEIDERATIGALALAEVRGQIRRILCVPRKGADPRDNDLP
jgi:hypothetical protein